MSIEKQSQQIFVFGEILWDCFTGDKILGGAPLNVAWNCQAFGLHPQLISRVGDDHLGQSALARLRQHGMSTEFIGVDRQHETGRVDVTLFDGEPSYNILPDVAYDYIELPKTLADSPRAARRLLYHGTLALRTDASRANFSEFCGEHKFDRFVDINVRHPFFDVDWLEGMLDGVMHVKLNIDELKEITGSEIPEGVVLGDSVIADAAALLLERYAVQEVWLTMGSQGAMWFDRSGRIESIAAPQPDSFRDAVGAGDAFASVVLAGISEGLTPAEILPKAVTFAAKVCSVQGATTDEQGFYEVI